MSSHRNAVLAIISFPLIKSQSLDLPAERFPCGSSNLTCERWGYTACVNPDGEFYCLPCNLEYVSQLCGKKEELSGCNLFCTEKKLKNEKERLEYLFLKEKNDLLSNCTAKLRKDKYTLQTKIQQLHKDESMHLNQIKSLKTESQVYVTLLSIFLLSSGCLIIWHYRPQGRNKTSADLESSEKHNLLKDNPSKKSLDEVAEECEVVNETGPVNQDKSTQTDDNEDVNECTVDEITHTKYISCLDSGCPGKDILQNVAPTENHQSGCDKMAIRSQDIDIPN